MTSLEDISEEFTKYEIFLSEMELKVSGKHEPREEKIIPSNMHEVILIKEFACFPEYTLKVDFGKQISIYSINEIIKELSNKTEINFYDGEDLGIVTNSLCIKELEDIKGPWRIYIKNRDDIFTSKDDVKIRIKAEASLEMDNLDDPYFRRSASRKIKNRLNELCSLFQEEHDDFEYEFILTNFFHKLGKEVLNWFNSLQSFVHEEVPQIYTKPTKSAYMRIANKKIDITIPISFNKKENKSNCIGLEYYVRF